MRMAGPDIVLLVVGALIFGGATYAIARSPGGLTGVTSAAGVFDVTFVLADAELGDEPVGSFRTGSVTFDVMERNVTMLTFSVTCSDAASAAVPYVIQLALTPPASVTAPGPVSGNCGSVIEIPVEIADTPEAASVPGDIEADARANLAEFPNSTRAVGAWKVDYAGARQGGGTALPIPAGDPGGSISLTAQTWRPRFAPVPR